MRYWRRQDRLRLIPITNRTPGGCGNTSQSGMPGWKELGHRTQAFSTTRYSRSDGPDRNFRERCGFLVFHPLQSDEQYYRPFLLGKFGESPFQIAKFKPHGLIGWEREVGIPYLQFGAGAPAHVTAGKADMLVVFRDDNIQLTANLREAHSLCEEHRDVASASLIEM